METLKGPRSIAFLSFLFVWCNIRECRNAFISSVVAFLLSSLNVEFTLEQVSFVG